MPCGPGTSGMRTIEAQTVKSTIFLLRPLLEKFESVTRNPFPLNILAHAACTRSWHEVRLSAQHRHACA